jgi:hypothetical protein
MITLNGVQVLDGWLRVPNEGAPSGTVELPAAIPDGLAVLSDGANSFRMVSRGSSYAGRFRAAITAGYLSDVVGPQHLRAGTVATALSRLCVSAGLLPSPLVRASIGSTPLVHWSRAAGTVGAAMRDLAARAGAVFRILPDGTAWIGAGAAIPRAPDWAPPTILDYSTGLRLITVDGGVFSVLPGDSIDGQTVSAVRYSLGPERVTEVWLNDD